jgi:hypothetical protein
MLSASSRPWGYAMTELRVFDVSASGRRVALRESANIFHVALTPLDQVAVDQRVCGESVAVGLCTMYDLDSHRTLAVLFEQTGCTLWEALDLLEEQ